MAAAQVQGQASIGCADWELVALFWDLCSSPAAKPAGGGGGRASTVLGAPSIEKLLGH